MPILSINPDGTVTIARKSGKDKKTVRPEELAQYNPSLLEDYNKFVGEKKTLEAGAQGLSEEEKKKLRAKGDADRILSQLEDLYFDSNSGKGLAYGRVGGILEYGKAAAGYNPDLNTYLTQLESNKPTFAKAAGDTGNFSKSEQESAIKQFPTPFSTKTEAKKYFAATRNKFGLKPSLRSFQ